MNEYQVLQVAVYGWMSQGFLALATRIFSLGMELARKHKYSGLVPFCPDLNLLQPRRCAAVALASSFLT